MGRLLIGFLTWVLAAQGWVEPADRSLELPDVSGQLRHLEEFKGHIVVLNFWATWCGPCIKEMPIFAEAQKRFGPKGVVVIAASLDTEETQESIPAFVKKQKMHFPVLLGATADHLDEFGLRGVLPGTVFLDRDGAALFRIIGQAHKKEVFERIEWMLGDRREEAPEPILENLPKTR